MEIIKEDNWNLLDKYIHNSGLSYNTKIDGVPLICVTALNSAIRCLTALLSVSSLGQRSDLGVGLVHYAIMSKNPDVLQLVLSHPVVIVNQRDGWDETPIIYAAKESNTVFFQLLCRHPKITVSDLLHVSKFNRDIVFYGKESRNKLAVAVGMIINPKYSNSWLTDEQYYDKETWYNMITHDTQIIRLPYLISNVPQGKVYQHIHRVLSSVDLRPIQMTFEPNVISPIFEACRSGDVSTIYQLQSHVNDKHPDGYFPLHAAVFAEQVETVKALLSIPFTNVNCQENNHITPLMVVATLSSQQSLSSQTNMLSIFSLLLSDNRINVNAQNTDGDTALIYAIGSCKPSTLPNSSESFKSNELGKQMVLLLLRRSDTDINLSGRLRCPLSKAISLGKSEGKSKNKGDKSIFFRLMENPHIDVNRYVAGVPVFLEAMDDEEMVNAFLNHPSFDVHVSVANFTILHYAVLHGNESLAFKLIDMGANIHTVSDEDRTISQLAALNNMVDLLKYCYDNNADLNFADRQNNTPLSLAIKNYKWEAVNFLLDLPDIIIDAEAKKWLNYTSDPQAAVIRNKLQRRL